MLDAAIGDFLDTVTEREFDPVIIALLAARGFHDIHFIHGSFEFGKDIIAKRADPDTGIVHQYAIQSKAGDLGQHEWRAVRPQLEEAEYNTLGHPNFDDQMPRVAVLLTTGRLKGAAPSDAQQFAKTAEKRGLARIEFWDRHDLTGWLTSRPDLALLSLDDEHALQGMLVTVRADTVDEPQLERFSRRWIDGDTAGIEAAVLINAFREHQRLDLAAMTAIHMFRGVLLRTGSTAESARRLFCAVSMLLLDAVEPLLADPADLARVDLHPASLVTYAVTAVRTTEILALAALVHDDEDERARLTDAVITLATSHPGTARPVSDQFAFSLIPITVVLHRSDPQRAAAYLRSVAQWLMERSDPERAGLGLGSMDETPLTVVERLLGGWLETTTLTRAQTSYVLTVLLDLCVAADLTDVFTDVRSDAGALRITPDATSVGTRRETFRRAGGTVRPVPRIMYDADGSATPPRDIECEWPPLDALLLLASCRSRLYTGTLTALLREA
ncbi:restriction endonuclease [Microbacterium oxydans]|uniref:restriction endonuclease n=1 Tax=Microbacterium sp. B19(2022) TaxID=2914045 RepID=UPI0014309E07|nr:restriction endonuclease [Microbacterium sp. B19(2022)]NJI58612.1 restriction endonuclease [Microbacterium sp. B19(2022)]